MLNHISIGVSSLANAKAFYDSILLPLGYRCLSEDAGAKGYGQRAVEFWLLNSESPVPDEARSGLHICFTDRPGQPKERSKTDHPAIEFSITRPMTANVNEYPAAHPLARGPATLSVSILLSSMNFKTAAAAAIGSGVCRCPPRSISSSADSFRLAKSSADTGQG